MPSEEPNPRLPWWRRWFGSRSERAAARHLRRLGYRVLARNVTLPGGELDLIALDSGVIVFAEVRSTSGTDINRPIESVDSAKQARVARAAGLWLQSKRLLGRPARFDVIAVGWPAGARRPEIRHFIAAFEPPGRFQFFD
jgi:putative endonuclease